MKTVTPLNTIWRSLWEEWLFQQRAAVLLTCWNFHHQAAAWLSEENVDSTVWVVLHPHPLVCKVEYGMKMFQQCYLLVTGSRIWFYDRFLMVCAVNFTLYNVYICMASNYHSILVLSKFLEVDMSNITFECVYIYCDIFNTTKFVLCAKCKITFLVHAVWPLIVVTKRPLLCVSTLIGRNI